MAPAGEPGGVPSSSSSSSLLPPGSAEVGRDLFVGRAGGDVVTFVCFRAGYGIRRNGGVAQVRWQASELEQALATFERIIAPRAGGQSADAGAAVA